MSNIKKSIILKTFIFSILIILLLMNWIFFSSGEQTAEPLTISIFLLILMMWITQVLPISVSGILMIVLFVITGVLRSDEAFRGLGEEIIWLITGVLVMGIAFQKTGLEQRLTCYLLSLAKGNLKKLLLYFIFSNFVLTFFVPNALGRLTLMHSVASGINDQLRVLGREKEINAFNLAVVFAPYITTVSLMTAASGSIYAVGLFSSKLNYSWNYLYWFLLMLPITIGSILLLWGLLCKFIDVNKNDENSLAKFFLDKRNSLQQISTSEIKMLMIYSIMIILWATTFIHQLPLSIPALLAMICLFVPGISLIDWNDVRNSFDFGIPILFASGLALATAFDVSGLTTKLSTIAYIIADVINVNLLPVFLVIFIVMVRLIFTNFNASVAIILPIIISFSLSLEFNSIWLTLLSLVACSIAFILPTQSFGSILMFSTGQLKMKEMGIVGFYLSVSIIVLTLLTAYFYWPLFGLPVR